MKKYFSLLILITISASGYSQFTLDKIMSYPFPADLTASGNTNKIAWTINEEGKRNVYVAKSPTFEARKLTYYDKDDGQEISSLSISDDGKWVVYIRGGEHGSNWEDERTINPLSIPIPPKVQMWSVPFDGGEPFLLGEGEGPVISPKNNEVVFTKKGQLWTIPIDTSAKAKQIIDLNGTNTSPEWSPDGSSIAFVSYRNDHSYIGIYKGPDERILWIDPGYDRDFSPRWSPDGSSIAFVRRPGAGGTPETILENHHTPWSVMTFNLESKNAAQLWKAPETLRGSIPYTHGSTNLNWASNDRIVFLSYHDGWPHVYAINSKGGEPLLLTPGNFMAEYISLSADKKSVVLSGNTGPDKFDIDRRHIIQVSVDKADMKVLTPGEGNEWAPKILSDGQLVFLSATAKRPPLPTYFDSKKMKLIGEKLIPESFPTNNLVTPKQVLFKSPDGLEIHGTWFEKEGGSAKKPAIIYVHGGPPRQMLLGWHYSSYYSNGYATNQYLASLGFIVVSVNYRLGIGYGYEFQYPANTSWRGAAEYMDIKAAGEWLAKQPEVDPSRIGIYGGSYGGFLTALALGKDSKLFAAGVDIHGVHDRTVNRIQNLINPDQFEKVPDVEKAPQIMWNSSPVAYVDTWTSPVLMIHGDDDRNVPFSQTVDLVQRLRKKGVEMETLVIVDDSHHFMVHENQKSVNAAVADFLLRKLK